MNCAVCKEPLEDALILSCDHNLCLPCAASEAGGKDSVICRLCGTRTTLDPSSAEQLRQIATTSNKLNNIDLRGDDRKPGASRNRIFESGNYPNIAAALGGNTPSSKRPPTVDPSTPQPPQQLQSSSLLPDKSEVQVKSQRCANCEASMATLRCSQCNDSFCSQCSSILHRRTPMSSHVIYPLNTRLPFPSTVQPSPSIASSSYFHSQQRLQIAASNNVQAAPIIRTAAPCPDHPDEPVQYFCLRCETHPVCSECVFRNGNHQTHLSDVVLLKRAVPMIKGKVSDVLNELQSSVRDYTSSLREVEEKKNQLVILSESCKVQMKREFEEIHEKLRNKEFEFTKKNEDMIVQEVDRFSVELEGLLNKQKRLENISQTLLNFASSAVLDEPSALLQTYADARVIINDNNNLSSKSERQEDTRISVPSDITSLHNDAINLIHSSITDMVGLLPSIMHSSNIPSNKTLLSNRTTVLKDPSAYNNNITRTSPFPTTSKTSSIYLGSARQTNADVNLMSAVSQAFSEPISPQHLSVMSMQTPLRSSSPFH